MSELHATTNHRLDQVDHPSHAARFNSVGRLSRLNELRAGATSSSELVAEMLARPMRSDEFDVGFGTLYTAEYQPAAGVATWHWPETSWTRGFGECLGLSARTLAESQSWGEVAGVAGTTKQAAWSRWHH